MGEPLYQIMGRHRAEPLPERKPSWLKVKAPGGPNYLRLKQLMRELDLHTVCEEAHCPNVGECWEHGTATFMILGDVCTRNCAYCAVAHGRPPKYDLDGAGARRRGDRARCSCSTPSSRRSTATTCPTSAPRHLRRDDPADSRRACPDCSVEVLVPDFQGNEAVDPHGARGAARHLQSQHRDGAAALQEVPARRPLRARDGDLPRREAPRARHPDQDRHHPRHGRDDRGSRRGHAGSARGRRRHPHARPVPPPVRRAHRARPLRTRPRSSAGFYEIGMAMGFRHVESGPLVRSSYHAWEQVQAAGV